MKTGEKKTLTKTEILAYEGFGSEMGFSFVRLFHS